jgi:type II secretory pathway pseudopilin PulG
MGGQKEVHQRRYHPLARVQVASVRPSWRKRRNADRRRRRRRRRRQQQQQQQQQQQRGRGGGGGGESLSSKSATATAEASGPSPAQTDLRPSSAGAREAPSESVSSPTLARPRTGDRPARALVRRISEQCARDGPVGGIGEDRRRTGARLARTCSPTRLRPRAADLWRDGPSPGALELVPGQELEPAADPLLVCHEPSARVRPTPR